MVMRVIEGRKTGNSNKSTAALSVINGGRSRYSESVREYLVIALDNLIMLGPDEYPVYVTFDTTYPGVDIGSLRNMFEGKMCIVFQHEWENLEEHSDYFEVTMSFYGDVRVHLVIPYASITNIVLPNEDFMSAR